MTEFNPLVTGVRNMQLSLVSNESKPSLASWCSGVISDLSVHDEHESFLDYGTKELGARIGVIAMPFFVGLSVFQLGGTLVCHITIMTLNNDWDSDLIGEYINEIACMVADIIAQIVVCPVAFVVPSLYHQDPVDSVQVPHYKEAKNLKKEIKQIEESLQAAVGSARTEIERLSADLLPAISPENPNVTTIPGLSTRTIQYDRGESRPEKPYNAVPTWSNARAENLAEVDEPTEIRVNDIHRFLLPDGTLEVTVDFTGDHKLDVIKKVLQKPESRFNRLILKEPPSIEFLEELNENSALSHIHTLVISQYRGLTRAQVVALAEKFPNIACFDLRSCRIDEPLDTLAENHIIFRPQVGERVMFVDNEGNVQEQYNDLNRKLFNGIKNLERGQFGRVLPDQHCVAPFITSGIFLENTLIHDDDLTSSLTRISELFPNMAYFSLSGCTLLSVKSISNLHELKGVETLELRGCSKSIVAKRWDEIGSDYHINHADGNRRTYKAHPYVFVEAIGNLYRSGVVNIRFNDVTEIQDTFTAGVNPFVEEFNRTHLERPVRLTYHTGERNVPYPGR